MVASRRAWSHLVCFHKLRCFCHTQSATGSAVSRTTADTLCYTPSHCVTSFTRYFWHTNLHHCSYHAMTIIAWERDQARTCHLAQSSGGHMQAARHLYTGHVLGPHRCQDAAGGGLSSGCCWWSRGHLYVEHATAGHRWRQFHTLHSIFSFC